MMIIDNKHSIGDLVYLKTDIDQNERLITGIMITQNGLQYELSFNTDRSWHFDVEISKDKDMVKTT